MRGMGFKAMGAKGMVAKGGFLKGIFGFVGGIFKLLFFGFFLIIFLIVAFALFFIMKRKTAELKNDTPRYTGKKEDEDIIDAEIIENYPTKR